MNRVEGGATATGEDCRRHPQTAGTQGSVSLCDPHFRVTTLIFATRLCLATLIFASEERQSQSRHTPTPHPQFHSQSRVEGARKSTGLQCGSHSQSYLRMEIDCNARKSRLQSQSQSADRQHADFQSRRFEDYRHLGPLWVSQRAPQRESLQDQTKGQRDARTTSMGSAALQTSNGSRRIPDSRDQIVEVERAENKDGWKVVQRRRRQGSPRQVRGILDPVQGLCFHCLSKEHYARFCRSPIRCCICRREGHRHAHCPLKSHGQKEKQEMDVKGLSSCLVGETRGGCTPPLD